MGVLALWLFLPGGASGERTHDAKVADGRTDAYVAEPVVWFTDVTEAAGLNFRNQTGGQEQRTIVESLSGGAGFLDYDSDGLLDLYVVNGSTSTDVGARNPKARSANALFRNEGNGRFVDVTVEADVGDRGWGMGVVSFDYNGDGQPDLYITNWGPDVLYRNNGNGTFSNVTDEAGVGDRRWGAGAAAADFDNDGDLDLFVACHVDFDPLKPPNGGELCLGYRGLHVYCGPQGLPPESDILYRNNGDGTFTDVSAAVGITHARYSLGAVWTDFDEDGDPDLFVAVDSQANLLYRNDDGYFQESGLTSGLAYSGDGQPQAGMGVAAGDYDGDGRIDIYLTHFSDDHNTLYRNEGEGYFSDVSWDTGLAGIGVPLLGFGTSFLDVECDGDLDLFVANGHIFPQVDAPGVGLSYAQTDQILVQTAGRFADISAKAGLTDQRVGRGAALADYDNDGDMDVLVVNLNDRLTLLRNDTRNRGACLTVVLEGEGANPEGVGARVEVSRGDRVWVQEVRRGESYLCTNDPRLHFGLGDSAAVDVRIRWPNGRLTRVEKVAPEGLLTAGVEGSFRWSPMAPSLQLGR
jgi:hypothetical protein